MLAENYLSAGAPFDYDAEDAERLEREQAPFRPFPPLWVRFLRVVGAALLVVLIQADWTQRKLRWCGQTIDLDRFAAKSFQGWDCWGKGRPPGPVGS